MPSQYDCMTPEEYALWTARIHNVVAKVPCRDCPLWFAAEARAAGKCCREPRDVAPPTSRRGPAPTYVTEEERTEARRRTWREAKARKRAAAVLASVVQ